MRDMQINLTPTGPALEVRHGDAKPIFNYQGYNYTADSTGSLITLVKAKGSLANSVIAYTEKGVKAILDDTVLDRKQDRIDFQFKPSLQYEEWAEILEGGAVFDQRNLLKFLQRREANEVECIENIIAAIQNFKYVTTIAGDFTYDDRNNYIFSVKVGEAEGTVRLPQTLYANIEFYRESGFVQMLELELEVQKPKGENEKPLFALTCPKLPRYKDEAWKHEIAKLKTELDGYLVVAGTI